MAKWRSYSFSRHRLRTSISAFSPRKVDGTRAKDPWCAPAGFSQGPAYKSRPGLLTRLGQIGVLGSAGGSTGWKDVSGAKTVRGSVVGFRMNLGTTCTLGPSPRRNSRQVTHQADRKLDTSSLSTSRRQTLTVVSHPAEGRHHTRSRSSSRRQTTPAASHTAEGRQTSCSSILAFLVRAPTGHSPGNP